MKKPSKNLGKSISCPECRKTLINSAKIIGQGSFKTKCKHCDSLILIEMGQKSFITASKATVLLLILGIAITYQIFALTDLKNAFMAMINNYTINVQR